MFSSKVRIWKPQTSFEIITLIILITLAKSLSQLNLKRQNSRPAGASGGFGDKRRTA